MEKCIRKLVFPVRNLEIVKTITNNHPISLVNSLNPYRIEGQKTAAFENGIHIK